MQNGTEKCTSEAYKAMATSIQWPTTISTVTNQRIAQLYWSGNMIIFIDGEPITAGELKRKLQLLDRLIEQYLPEELI